MSLNTSLICKRLVNFLKSSLKRKWLNFGVGVIFCPLFTSNNCDHDNIQDDRLIIFCDIIFFVRFMMVGLYAFLAECY